MRSCLQGRGHSQLLSHTFQMRQGGRGASMVQDTQQGGGGWEQNLKPRMALAGSTTGLLHEAVLHGCAKARLNEFLGSWSHPARLVPLGVRTFRTTRRLQKVRHGGPEGSMRPLLTVQPWFPRADASKGHTRFCDGPDFREYSSPR